jgi:glycyl-tRNA synthetase beta chain
MGRKPTGSSDPYALRRQAQGVIDIAAHAEIAIDLSAIVGELIDLIVSDVKNTKLSASEAKSEIAEFLLQRLRTKLHESGLAREVVEAVTASGDALISVPNTIERCQALSEFAESKAGVEILRACVRVSNIIGDEEAGSIDSIALSEQSEMALLEGFRKSILSRWPDLEKQGAALETKTDYNEYLKSFEPLVPLINTFFDELMVNDPDPVKKINRRSLLANINKKLKTVGDFSKLLPLLN